MKIRRGMRKKNTHRRERVYNNRLCNRRQVSEEENRKNEDRGQSGFGFTQWKCDIEEKGGEKEGQKSRRKEDMERYGTKRKGKNLKGNWGG